MSMLDRVRATGADGDLAALNAVPVTVAEISEGGGRAPAARLAALCRWRTVHDPRSEIDEAHLLDAAALATLIDTDDGPGFDDARFGELVAFVAELPW
jgi:hypothetical protein